MPGKVRGLVDSLIGEQISQGEAGQIIVFMDNRFSGVIIDTVDAGKVLGCITFHLDRTYIIGILSKQDNQLKQKHYYQKLF